MQTFRVADAKQVADVVTWAAAEEQPLEIVGGGSKQGLGRPTQVEHKLDVSSMAGISVYEPGELVLTAAAATPLTFGEIYTALQAGVLDGLEHDPPTILASKFYETAKFYALTQHNFSPLAVYFSDMTFNRMDPKLRDGFLVRLARV